MNLPQSGIWTANLLAIAPELILMATMLIVLLFDATLRLERSQRAGVLALAGTLLAIVVAAQLPESGDALFGMVANDAMTRVFRLLIYGATVVVILLAMGCHDFWRLRMGEFYFLLLAAATAAVLLVASRNWVMFVLGIETLSICSYALAGYRKGHRHAAEAALKYLLFDSVAAAVMIYGISLVYGLTGSLDLSRLSDISQENRVAAVLAFVLILAGLAFKVGAAPFHFWTPDVYEGSTVPVTTFLATVSKAAGFGALLRLFAPPGASVMGGLPPAVARDLMMVFWMVAMVSMIVGNFAALRQVEMRRLMAYSSVAQTGYLLIPFAAVPAGGASYPVVFYLCVYLIATAGVFTATLSFQNRTNSTEMSHWSGLMSRSPLMVVCLGVLLWSLIGLPPTAGFVGKWLLFSSAVEGSLGAYRAAFSMVLVLTGLLTSVVSLAYYIGILRPMIFRDTDRASMGFRPAPLERLALAGFAIPILLLQLQWQPLARAVTGATGRPPLQSSALDPGVPAGRP